ncbi:hypothetical protein SUGI_0642570 [Cryptomeria japonica]|nr:hypothetical protein SUGI_0642570 [Cryptomeria japonica]
MEKCFRETHIIPPARELLPNDGAGGESCVPINRVAEPYDNVYNYLDTQFRVIREDLLEAYRECVKKIRGSHKNTWEFVEQKGSSDFQVYNSVEYVGMRGGRDGVEYGLSFNVGHRGGKHVEWEKSKLLMSNSLLCISQDGFQTFSWATVCNRDRLKENLIGVKPVDVHELNLQSGVFYTMFESSKAYYEAYVHVLKNIQRPEMDNIKFTEQLVYLESNTAQLEYNFNWKQVCKCDSIDDSQEAAINHGLTEKLAIIQGPPGTGKTFTGLQIVKALLYKKITNSSGPILIVCFTNRALDQFLEGIYEYEKSLARLGSRTQSSILIKCTLDHLMDKRKKKKKSNGVPKKFYQELQKANKNKATLARVLEEKCLHGIIPTEEISRLSSEYMNACCRLQDAKRNIHCLLLGNLKVVGMTSTFAARNYELLSSLKSEIMVVEEAAQLLEGQILGCLNPCIKHLILIGDHKQLRPSVASPVFANTHKLDFSMFERLVTSGLEYKTLEVQRRMRPEISAPLVSTFYPMLKDHPSVCEFLDVKGVKGNVLFIDHHNPEDPSQFGSRSNAMEADMVVQFCMYLTNSCGYKPLDITILTMYRAQTDVITKKIGISYPFPGRKYHRNASNKWVPDKNTIDPDEYVPKVRSVDEFQGEESNIILLSLVRNINPNLNVKTSENIGFLNIPNRICVALSRARIGLYIFGNSKLLTDNSLVWKDIIKHFTDNVYVGNGIPLYCPRHPDDAGPVVTKSHDLRRKVCHSNSYDKECFPCLECRSTGKVCNGLRDLLLS